MSIGEIIKIVTEQKQRDNLIREHAAKFAEEFENSSSTINKKLALFAGFKFGAYWADEHPFSDGKELLHVAQKTAERTKKEIISKACDWLKENIDIYAVVATNLKSSYPEIVLCDTFEKNFKKAMEE